MLGVDDRIWTGPKVERGGEFMAKCVGRWLTEHELQNDVENLQGKVQKRRTLRVVHEKSTMRSACSVLPGLPAYLIVNLAAAKCSFRSNLTNILHPTMFLFSHLSTLIVKIIGMFDGYRTHSSIRSYVDKLSDPFL